MERHFKFWFDQHIPVRLYSASHVREVTFKLLHKKDKSEIRMKLLKKYLAKRDLKKSKEPKAKEKKTKEESLRFVVQEHHARHLHYDFRLEYKGILLSWAIPKGPSMDPKTKRLAVHVEDHPLDYGEFEGTIPKGNYGAGTVKIWDKGTYEVRGASSKKEAEQLNKEGLEKGHLQIHLQGKKLKGDFDLVHLKNADKENLWILIKKSDKYAIEEKQAPTKPLKKIKKK